MSTEATNETAAPTLDEVGEKEERIRDLKGEITELESREADLTQRITDRTAGGEDTSELSDERRRVQQRREDVQRAVSVLEDEVETARERAIEREAHKRLKTIKKMCGGIAGEHPRRLERLEAAVEAVEKGVEALNAAYAKQAALRQEADALSDRWGLDVPELKTVLPPTKDPEAAKLADRLSALRLSERVRRRNRKPPAERARHAADRLEEHGEKSPTPELFSLAGEIGEEAWREELRRRGEARKREMEDRRQRLRDDVDTWLREHLAQKPVLRDRVVEAAREELADELAGIGLTKVLKGARRRLDVREFVHASHPGSYFWGLPDTDTGAGTPWGVPDSGRFGRVAHG